MTVSALMATPSCRPTGLRTAVAEASGDKVAGLLRLPPDWYPPTLVVPTWVHEQVRSAADAATSLTGVLDDEFLAGVLPKLALDRADGLLVRSSARGETIAERGRYESVAADATAVAVRAALAEVWSTAAERDRDAHSPAAVAAALQPRLVPFAKGHLSNEHRVCRDSTNWLVEGLTGPGSSTMWRVTNAAPAGDKQLACHDGLQLRRQLRAVARRLSDQPYRHHLEWVWDGARLWTVQCDRVPVLIGESPGELWRPTRGRTVDPSSLLAWRRVPTADGPQRWGKLECRRKFGVVGLPVADVFALSGTELILALAEGTAPEPIVQDLQVLCDGHLLVRTDVAGGHTRFMLPKTEAETDPAVVLSWLQETARHLLEEGAPASDVVFIAHRFLRSRACAWSYAKPEEPIVRIDALWGLSDGLGWLPHDTALVDVDSGEVKLSIGGKPTFLDVAPDHRWRYRDTPTEWIWRASVSEDQLRTMGRGAHRLAQQTGRPVITMWFVGLLDGAEADTLPWFQATWPGDDEEAVRRDVTSPRHTITDAQHLDELPTGDITGHVLQLRPGEALIRDTGFVDRVAAVALDRGLVVEMEGSRLAHPYYMLRRHGVPVTFRMPSRSNAAEETAHNKLVRDQIPDLISGHGEHAVVYRASDSERRSRLRAKAVEEALELLAAASVEEEMAEAADLLEVLDALGAAGGWSRADIEAEQQRKREQRGGFDEGYVLVSTAERAPAGETPEDSPNADLLPGMPRNRPVRTLLRHLDGALEVGLVPPERGDQRTFRTQLSGRTAQITYTDGTVTVRLEPSPVTAPAGFEQPDLWS